MAEPARKISSQGANPIPANVTRSAPANSNASSLRGASLRVLQGGRSRVVRENRNQPTLHPLSQLEMARQLQEGQARDRMSMSGDDEVSDDTLKSASGSEGSGSVLDLEPQSYVNREETSAQSEASRQRKMAQVGARFLHPETMMSGAENGGEQIDQGQRVIRRRASSVEQQGQSERKSQDQFAQAIQADQRQMVLQNQRKSEGSSVVDAVSSAEDKMQEVRRFTQLVTKILEISSVILAIWVWIALNIETLNILLFRKKLPRALNSKLNLIGLNIDVDPKHPFSGMNLVVVGLTLFVNIVLTFILIIVFALLFFIFYWMMEAMTGLSYLGISL